MLLTKRGKSHERKRNHQQSPNIRLRGTNGCGPRVNRQSQRCHTNQLCTFFKILCRSCGPVVRWHHSHRKQPRKRRLPVKPVRGTYRTILRQRTLPGEKRGRTGHCGIRPRDFPKIPHPSLRSLPASHPWSGRTVRSPHTHPAVLRRGHLRGRLHQSPAPVAVYGRNHERIKYFSYLCAVLQTKTYIIRYIEYD